MDYKQFSQLNLGTMPTDELFNLYKQAKTSSYKQPKLPMWDDPQMPVPQQETRYAPVEYTPEQAVSRANQQYANDRHGMQQLGKIGAETASMLPTAVAGGLAGGSAMVGAKAGGATWDEALGSYNEASDAAKQVVHNVLGNPSELMEAFDTYGFAPVNEYITKQSGDPRLGERLMDLLVMRGGLHGKQGKVAEFGQKAADTGLVTGAAAISPQLQDMSDDELGKLALAVGAVKTIGYHGGPEGITKLKPQEGGLGAVYVAPSRFEAKGYGIPFENEVPYKVGLDIQNPKYMPSEMVEGRPSSRGITPEIAEEYKSQGHDAVIGIDPKTGRPREYAVLNPDVTTILPSADKQAVQQWKNPVKSIKEQIFNLQKAIRETPDPVQKAELGRQIKELQQSKPVQQQAPKELPYNPVNPEGATFQSALLNAFEDPKFPQGKLNGPQLYKELKKRQVTNDEIQAVYGDLQSRGIRDVSSWKNVDNTVSLGEDVYGGKIQEDLNLAKAQVALQKGKTVKNVYTGETFAPDDLTRFTNMWDTHIDLGYDKFEVVDENNKPPQFSSYQAIKSQEGVVPGSYTEEFVTVGDYPSWKTPLDEQKLKDQYEMGLINRAEYNAAIDKGYIDTSRSWKDEHTGYESTKNPLVRLRYDVKEYPDGRKTLRLHEIQEPQPVRKSRPTVLTEAKKQAKANDLEYPNTAWDDLPEDVQSFWLQEAEKKVAARHVPHELATRAMDLGIKKAVARAKELGLDGIEWSTAEQQKDLYNNALRNIADEARWNPETKEFQLYKDGRRVTKGVPETLEQNQLKNWIGESGAQRLVESKLPKESRDWYESIDGWNLTGTDWAIEDLGRSKYKIYNKKTGYNELAYSEETAKRRAEKRANKDVTPFHTATDLSIDAKWPTKLYGDFKTIGKSNKPLDIDKMYDKVVNNNIDIGIAFKPEFSKLFKDNRNYEAAKKYRLEDDYDVMEEAQEFQSDLIQYIVENPNSDFAKRAMGENWQFDNMSVGSGDFDYSAQVPGLLKKYGKGEFGVSGEKMSAKELAELSDLEGQLSLSLKEIDRLDDLKAKLAGEIPQQPVMWFTKDTPSKFNIYEWAAITGLSVKMIEEYLNADDNKKQRMMKVMPVLGSIMTQRGNIRNTVGKTPSFIGREIAQPKALPSDAAIRAQEGIKNQILNSKLVPPGFPVRMTNIGELLNIAENSKLREGIAHEGNPGISAQVIPQGVKNPPIQSYGGNNLRSVAVIFPKDAVVNKGVNPNEVKINPSFDPNKARYLVSGYKRALTLTEVKSLIKKGLLTE